LLKNRRGGLRFSILRTIGLIKETNRVRILACNQRRGRPLCVVYSRVNSEARRVEEGGGRSFVWGGNCREKNRRAAEPYQGAKESGGVRDTRQINMSLGGSQERAILANIAQKCNRDEWKRGGAKPAIGVFILGDEPPVKGPGAENDMKEYAIK